MAKVGECLIDSAVVVREGVGMSSFIYKSDDANLGICPGLRLKSTCDITPSLPLHGTPPWLRFQAALGRVQMEFTDHTKMS